MGLQRIVPSLVVLCSGVALLGYGTMFRTVVVFREEQTEHSIPVPAPFFSPFSQLEQEPFSPAFESVNPFEQQRSPQEVGERNPFESPWKESNDVADEPSVDREDPLGVVFETVTQIDWIGYDEPEWALVREVTVGGVARREGGGLRRTYQGQRPLLCPT